jgi:hypothetical protein
VTEEFAVGFEAGSLLLGTRRSGPETPGIDYKEPPSVNYYENPKVTVKVHLTCCFLYVMLDTFFTLVDIWRVNAWDTSRNTCGVSCAV